MNKDCSTCICKEGSCYPSTTIFDKDKTCKSYDPDYEGYIAKLKQQIEKMKRHCNCKHRDSEGYCEVKRIYIIDLSYDGCDKWELED